MDNTKQKETFNFDDILQETLNEMFTNSIGDRAVRLQLRGKNEEDYGGRCRSSAETVLREFFDKISSYYEQEINRLKGVVDRLNTATTRDGNKIYVGLDDVYAYHEGTQKIERWETGVDELGSDGRAWPVYDNGDYIEVGIGDSEGVLTKQVSMCFSSKKSAEEYFSNKENR